MVIAFIRVYQSGGRKKQSGYRAPMSEQGYGWLSVFTALVHHHYDRGLTSANGFTLIKLRVGGNDELAFDEFFRLLPIFEKDVKELGLNGVLERYIDGLFPRRISSLSAQPKLTKSEKNGPSEKNHHILETVFVTAGEGKLKM
jgi:hypothetical protein